MASPPSPTMSFTDFPEDVQLNILSFLTSDDITSFACTSRRSASLCGAYDLWLSMCDRRWGSLTLVRSWTAGGRVPIRRLYKALDRWENLIGFWRRIGDGAPGTPPLVFFEWGPSFVTGSRVSPSSDPGSYSVFKIPFIWLGFSPSGEPVCYIHPGSRFESPADFLAKSADSNLIEVDLSFMGHNQFVLEENPSFYGDIRGDDPEESASVEGTSPPDSLTSEIYQYFANRTSPGGDKASRRQRRKERGRFWRRCRRWPRIEAEHFLKIEDYYPTPERPLQGIWKGFCEGMRLDFYLVAYDELGGITCRRVGDAMEPFSGYSPVFWTSKTNFFQPPFSREEEELYTTREHIRPVVSNHSNAEWDYVSRILRINSSYDLAIPDPAGSFGDPRSSEGRIWEYENGTFSFGFLRHNFIVDLKHVTVDVHLLDTVEYYFNASCL